MSLFFFRTKMLSVLYGDIACSTTFSRISFCFAFFWTSVFLEDGRGISSRTVFLTSGFRALAMPPIVFLFEVFASF